MEPEHKDCLEQDRRFAFVAWSDARTRPSKNTFYKFSAAEINKKDFLENFCEVEDAECLAHFAAAQNAPNANKPNRIPGCSKLR
jgi:hypothetical protein